MICHPRFWFVNVLTIATLAIVTGCSNLKTASNPQTSPAASPSVTNPDTPQMALATHLKQASAKMYGAYWCSVCNWQRQQFGEAAFNQIAYVECDPRGTNPQVNLCNKANIQAFPTWEINGKLYPPGGYPLPELAELSGYSGPRDF